MSPARALFLPRDIPHGSMSAMHKTSSAADGVVLSMETATGEGWKRVGQVGQASQVQPNPPGGVGAWEAWEAS
jgi:hypothetical protein